MKLFKFSSTDPKLGCDLIDDSFCALKIEYISGLIANYRKAKPTVMGWWSQAWSFAWLLSSWTVHSFNSLVDSMVIPFCELQRKNLRPDSD